MELSCRLKLFVCCFFVLGATKLFALDSLRVEESGGQYFVIHRVESGETLYSLTKKYGATLSEVVKVNSIENNQIGLYQELKIPISKPATIVESKQNPAEPDVQTQVSESIRKTHTVEAGQTLYAISRKYEVNVQDIKKWNNLSSNELNIGQVLVVSGGGETANSPKPELKPEESKKPELVEKEVENKVPEGFTVYYVQSGDLLESISGRFKVKPDSIVIWNDLPNTYLSVGQKLLIRGSISDETLATATDVEELGYGKRRTTKDQSGFTKIFEEGVARKIEDVNTEKYLALHRELAVGSLVEIRNLMNNQKIFARVVGKLPETGLNENVLIRLTPICFDRLGVIDPKTRVEVSYYED